MTNKNMGILNMDNEFQDKIGRNEDFNRGKRRNEKEKQLRYEKKSKRLTQGHEIEAEFENDNILKFVSEADMKKAQANARQELLSKDLQDCLPKPKGKAKYLITCHQ